LNQRPPAPEAGRYTNQLLPSAELWRETGRRCRSFPTPNLIDLVVKEVINPGKVFDLTLPLSQVAEGYRAMDERRAIKTLLLP
jgi:threonine dehydrogenase-like Zn-dependent dehydrogenase